MNIVILLAYAWLIAGITKTRMPGFGFYGDNDQDYGIPIDVNKLPVMPNIWLLKVSGWATLWGVILLIWEQGFC